MFIRGKKIELRAIEPEDLEYITDLLSTSRASSCLFGYPMMHKGVKFSDWLEMSARDKNAFYYAVKETTNFDTIGVCAYQEIDYKNGSVTVCVALAPEYANSEYGPEVLQALSDHAFYQLRIEHVSLYCLEKNIMMKVWAMFAGFRQDALLYSRIKREDERLNIALYSLLKEEGELTNECK